MAKDGIKVIEIEVVDGLPVVKGEVGDTPFVARTLRWGSKMLMKVDDTTLDRGTRIAVGHAAKKALKAAGIPLPEAVLKRPRKVKVEVVTPAASEASDSGERTEVEFTTLEEAVAEVS
jgi:hypothetical protein